MDHRSLGFIVLNTLIIVGGAIAQPTDIDAIATRAKTCDAKLASNTELAPLSGKVMLSIDKKPSFEMQAIGTKPSPKEKLAISRFAQLRGECFDIQAEWLKGGRFPSIFSSIQFKYRDDSDALLLMLYRGELTFGDFNQRQLNIRTDAHRKIDEGISAFKRDLEAQAAKRNLEHAANRPNIASDRYSCEKEAAQLYPTQMAQRMIDPGYQAPSLQQGQQTNCLTAPGAIYCNSSPNTGFDLSYLNRQPTFVTEDLNASRRSSAFNACMEAKGYK